MSTQTSYQLLINKLDAFIRRYYTNQLVRGLIFSSIYILGFFLFINVVEYYMYLPAWLRKVLFFGFIGSSLVFAGRFIGVPLLKYYRLGKIISYEQAALIVGAHFSEVKDKLLNILQLKNESEKISDPSLILAAIDQKAIDLKPVNFSFAIDLNKNRKYLKFLAPPLLLLLFVLIAAPNVIKEGTKRLYYNNRDFEREAPFRFVIQNKDLKALQFESYTLQVATQGDALPADVLISSRSGTNRMKKVKPGLFEYEFNDVRETFTFKLSAGGFDSKTYTLKVVPKPIVAQLEVYCDYPAYTGKKDEWIKNTGDLVVPQGTRLKWKINTQNANGLLFQVPDTTYRLTPTGTEEFTFSLSAQQSSIYSIRIINSELGLSPDSSVYSLQVTPDLHPVITVSERNDSTARKFYYYVGEISDDYGIRRLTFNYQITKADSSKPGPMQITAVPYNAGTASRFAHYWSLQEMQIKPGDKVVYYFEVCDNDGINGSKCSRTSAMVFEMPGLQELNKQLTRENKEMKDELKATMKEARDLQNQLKDMQDKLMEKQNPGWEDKKSLADNINKQKELQEQLEQLKEKLQQNFEKQNEFKDVSENIREKQKNLQEVMNKVLDDEMKKLMEKLEKMLEDLQKKDALDKMSDMQVSNEKLEKELDRMLELFKKLEFQQKMDETARKLDELAQKQEELAKQQEKNADGKDSPEAQKLKEQQDKLKEELKDARNDLNELKKLNEETRSQQDFNEVEKSLDMAEQQMNDAGQNQQQNQNSKASQNQKKAANNMKNASDKLNDMQMQMQQDEMAEDMQTIRALLKNIIRLSFDQEALMKEVKSTNINNPRYVQLMKEQQRIRENSRMVEDSLYALAKRQEAVKSFITKEISSINKYLGKTIAEMEERNVIKVMSNQQFVMTGYNNLALMMEEALQQMQQQMSESQQQKSSGSPKNCMKCKKPGAGLPNLSKMQKQLNDKIQQMGEMMKREGQQGKPSQQGMSKEFAEMAQMQQKIRKELERINQQENKDGKSPLGNLGEAIKKMEETEKNLVNKQLTAEMLKRQQDIMSKLLEAENAQRQREEQPERESNTGRETERKLPPSLEEYLRARQNETDLYKTVPPELKLYYKNMAEKYFRTITNEP